MEQSDDIKWSPALLDLVGTRAMKITGNDGDCLFSPGSACENFLIATSGAVRVEQTNSAGRTVVLYRVESGDSCVITTSCLLSGRPYSAYGYAEGSVSALALGANAFRTLLDENQEFRAMVFSVFSRRISELTHVIDDLLLHRVDQRLAHWLISPARKGATIPMTQQEIASELGTAREVVSRILKEFERQGAVVLGRGSIRITSVDKLRNLGKSDDV